jgi:hypothetical protein
MVLGTEASPDALIGTTYRFGQPRLALNRTIAGTQWHRQGHWRRNKRFAVLLRDVRKRP